MTSNTERLYQLFLESKGVSTDTRSLKTGQLFFAIKGPNFNGNLFAQNALKLGAIGVVVDDEINVSDERIIKSNDVLTELQMLAKHHRKQLQIPVIAICGSNGKTTTKELTSSILSEAFNVFSTKGNLNNHIGVPLSLLSINSNHQIAVIEIGANHLGETKLLCNLAQPTHGLITNNGKDHLEGYGSLEGVRKGNAELFEYLKENNGIGCISSMQEDLSAWKNELQSYSYGISESDFISGKVLENFPSLKIQLNFAGDVMIINSNIYGEYNFENILAASCLSCVVKVELEKIKLGIEKYFPSNNRSQIVKKDSNTFILDAYNANPSSMMAALQSFEKLNADTKIFVLGDMLELGTFSELEHQNIYQTSLNMKVTKRVFIGPEFLKTVKPSSTEICFRNVMEASAWFSNQIFTDTVFLLKGSRGMTLEKLLS